MSHEEIKKLISAYIDGEVSDREKKQVQDHLSRCAECRQEFRELTALEEVLHNMKLKKPSKEIWDVYWSSVYNRLERKIGWIVLSLGLIILIGVGAFPAIKDLILNPEIPLVLKVGLLIFSAGGIIVFVSILREQLFFWKRERYKEVKK
jgi:predicted anti-sigma-YlaC factor YlaD